MKKYRNKKAKPRTRPRKRKNPLPPVDVDYGYKEAKHGILTVKQLRKLLEGLDAETQIVVGTDDWYNNIAGVHLPQEDGYICLTFVQGEPYDTRQQ